MNFDNHHIHKHDDSDDSENNESKCYIDTLDLCWWYKYRPKSIDDLNHNYNVNDLLKVLASKKNIIPHIVFYGPDGSGKRTRISLLLNLMFKEYDLNMNTVKELDIFLIDGEEYEYCWMQSKVHEEHHPAELEQYDKKRVVKILKNIGEGNKRGFDEGKSEYKILIFHEVDKLSKLTQSALRRYMEIYMGNMRIIFTACNITEVPEPIRSRCVCIRVSAPPYSVVKKHLMHISKSEGSNISEDIIDEIVTDTNRNMSLAIARLHSSIGN